MDYHYEALNDQSFQKLAQALIVAQHPNTQCLPVGQPDGGRDAYFSSYCQKLWMEHQAAISSSRTPLMNFTFSMTSPRRR